MKKTAVFAALIAAVALAGFLIYDGVFNKTASADFFAMNTYVTADITGRDSAECAEEAQKIVESLDTAVLSRTAENSVVSRINLNGSGELDEKTAGYVSKLIEVCKKSGGAFDFTLGSVSDLWSFGSSPAVPDSEKLSQALSHSGYEKIILSGGRIEKSDKEATLDFGAAGKGIALDEIKSCLESRSVKNAVVSVGGSVLLFGKKEFTVGIRDPFGNSGSYVAKLGVSDCCVSTSGCYEQQFEHGGKKYHHILDPETGYPVDNGLLSVTVISESGLLSDALSTACFVLGIEKGSALAREYGCTAIFIDEDKNIYVEGDSGIIEITDGAYSFTERT